LAESLNAGERAGENTSGLGDPFLLPSSYADKSLPELRGEFGPQFAETVWEQVPGTWQGPVPTAYGLHVVYVLERTDAKLPDFSELKERLTADWMAARERELAGEVYDRLRERYRVLVEGMPYDMDKGK
jgi:parvulin-like peptidyl-prolyl isomerase